MKLLKISLILQFIFGSLSAQDLSVKDLTCEHKNNPIGIDVLTPRFSWKIIGKGNNIIQNEYYIEVSTDEKFSNDNIVWRTKPITSNESVLQPYLGEKLLSGQRYYWHVKITDQQGRKSKWSEPAFFEMGLLSPDNWRAKWIEMDGDTLRYSPAPHFRKEIYCNKKKLPVQGFMLHRMVFMSCN